MASNNRTVFNAELSHLDPEREVQLIVAIERRQGRHHIQPVCQAVLAPDSKLERLHKSVTAQSGKATASWRSEFLQQERLIREKKLIAIPLANEMASNCHTPLQHADQWHQQKPGDCNRA